MMGSRQTEAGGRGGRPGNPIGAVLTIVAGVVLAMMLPAQDVDALAKAIPLLGRSLNWLEKLNDSFDMVHVVFFVGVGAALRWVLRDQPWWRLLCVITLLGAGAELLQFASAGRTPSVMDARDDVLGGGVGLLLAAGLLWCRYRLFGRARARSPMATELASTPLRDWLAAALRSGRPPPLDPSVSPQDVLAAAQREGVTAILEARLQAEGGWQALPEPHRAALRSSVRTLGAQWLLRMAELRQIESAFAAAGMRVLLLKGAALSLWLYPQPYLRMGGDVDVLLEPGVGFGQAIAALAALGYKAEFMPGDCSHEVTLSRRGEGGMRSELDVHSRLIDAPVYAERLGFEELWDAGRTLPGLGEAMRALSPVHALVHACLNRAVDMQNAEPDRLKLLHDLRLLAACNAPETWEALCILTAAKGVAGICLRSLDDAARQVGAAVSPEVRARLQAQADAEPLDYRRLEDWRYMQRQNLRALPNLGARLRWLRQRLLPGASQLRHLYGDLPIWRLWLKRLQRGVGRVIGGR